MISTEESLLRELTPQLLDPLARNLANHVQWWKLSTENKEVNKLFIHENQQFSTPIAIKGEGSPILLLHGFDSCFLEFRRLAPLLSAKHTLYIPDLYGFGFCPRPRRTTFGPIAIIEHLNTILSKLPADSKVGLIGASMGGAVAMELARQNPNKINRLLLLSPAGLTGRPMKVPPPLDQLGVCFLSLPKVRKGLCRRAFSNPDKSVGEPEEQIASIHLKVPGWRRSLAKFARSGGMANYGPPLPQQPLHVMWGNNDNILQDNQKKETYSLLNSQIETLNECGHLPHLEHPEIVAQRWLGDFPN